jgi:hypothetical protein
MRVGLGSLGVQFGDPRPLSSADIGQGFRLGDAAIAPALARLSLSDRGHAVPRP